MGTRPSAQTTMRQTTEQNRQTSQVSNPWAPVQGSLVDMLGQGREMFGQGAFAPTPYRGERVAGFGDASRKAQQTMMQRAAMGAPLIDAASGTLVDMMQGGANPALEQVKANALSSAIPAAVAQFSGSGMIDSPHAVDYATRAATEAVSPYEFKAWENAQGRAMQAARMAPGIEQAGYLPAMIMGRVGGAQDAMRQAQIDADMARHYETEAMPAQNYQQYLATLMGLGEMGGETISDMSGTSAMMRRAPGPMQRSTGSRIAGGLSTGIGTGAALAPVLGPFAIPVGLAAGLAGGFA